VDCFDSHYDGPYTFVVTSILLVILGIVAIYRTPVDIFPNINIPVVGINWYYTGLSPEDMSNRIVYGFERNLPNSVKDMDHIESQSLPGIAVVKVYFHPNADITAAIAEITGVAQKYAEAGPPPGTTPPFVFLPTMLRRCLFSKWRCRGRPHRAAAF
jgi:multidrug efflux pump subunit AcrB